MKKILIAILLLAAFLRFWKIESVPPATSMDEASISYNAYSVLKTGGDEYGEFPLISQRGYDDWRRSTYLFLATPFVAAFGLRPLSVRLPAVLLSLASVWALFHITLLLSKKHSVALLAAFLLAISPWHVYISRLGHESNAYLSFFLFGLLLFLQSLKEKKKIWFSLVFFTLSLISYYAGQVFLPVFSLGVAWIYRKKLSSFRVPIIVFTLLLIPILWNLFSPSAMVRFQGTSAFSAGAHSEEFARRVVSWNEAVSKNNIIGIVKYHRFLFPVQIFLRNYLSHFSPQWLFANSGSEPFKAPNIGLLHLWELPFIAIGIVAARKKPLLLLWLLLAPLPASVATQAPHAMRSYLLLPPLVISAAIGIIWLFSRVSTPGVVAVAALVVFGFLAFAKNYYVVFPKEQSRSFHYPLSRAIPFVLSQKDNFEKIVFSNEGDLYQSYMVFLYYSKYDPFIYQSQGGTKSGGFAEWHAFGKYEFRPIDWETDSQTTDTLYIGNVSDFPGGTSIVASFAAADGQEVIQAVAL